MLINLLFIKFIYLKKFLEIDLDFLQTKIRISFRSQFSGNISHMHDNMLNQN